MISYICFKNATAFEQWQKENPQLFVKQIQPIVTGFEFDLNDVTDHKTCATATTDIKVFVTYMDN